MSTGDLRQLQWVARNRARRERAAPAGGIIAEVVRSAGRTDGALLDLLSERLAQVVDEEFRRHCRAVAVRSGRLVVGVDAPSMVSLMQTCWRSRLSAAIRRLAPRCGVHDVQFEFGLTGSRFQSAMPQSPQAGAAQTSPAVVGEDTIYG